MNGRVTLNPFGRHGLLAAIFATAVLALLTAACSGSGSNGPARAAGAANGGSATGSGGSRHAGGASSSVSAVAFSACMRTHGVPKFPDPLEGGALQKTDPTTLGVSTSQFQAATRSCLHLLPARVSNLALEQCQSAGACTAAETQRLLNAGLSMARCMRAHGLPNWPDPAADPLGRVAFPISIGRAGFDPRSPEMSSTENNCPNVPVGFAISP